MWFKNKPKNRRFEREHVLDVKMHSKHVRAARGRLLARTLTAVLGAGVGGLLLWRASEWALDRFVYRNPTFAVREIDVSSDGILPVDRLRRWTNVELGDNLLAINLQQLKRNLELNSMVAVAAVDRIYPGTLWVRITEREPVAQFTVWRSQGADGSLVPQTSYLDGEGYVLTRSDMPGITAEVVHHLERLPVFSGLGVADLGTGRRVEAPRVQAALRLVREFAGSSMAGRVELKEIDLSQSTILEVRTLQGGSIVFPLEGFTTLLGRWRIVHDHAREQGKAVASLDLSVSNNVPVRWIEAGAVPPATPKQAPKRSPKKHV